MTPESEITPDPDQVTDPEPAKLPDAGGVSSNGTKTIFYLLVAGLILLVSGVLISSKKHSL
jgi:hypothetical protein